MEKGSEKQAGGARNLIDERAGDTTFDLKDDVVAPNNYWGIIFTSTRKIKYGQREVDVLRDSLHPHLVLLRVLHDPLKPNTKPLSTDVITNVGLKKFLLFSDKDDDSDYHASVRALGGQDHPDAGPPAADRDRVRVLLSQSDGDEKTRLS